ncbi:aminoglycoside phosphotransferase family protein [Nodosilinea sp. PGN35]|uniref:aminoglycoside phosphotransferase family protein n=1 Tax=Nodosilinea sp. PGN35 TaxID=3020489 RepID=UPI0023B2AF94|nr:aminoglycoside phosphotransferase family protein [Nodosilinea sp. TSF1-S3]MDF0365459.1 aminoglycoside phosphotransferase family protein [Nodosilinea sp. TSF1-S3]
MPPQNPGRLAQTPDAEVAIDAALVHSLIQAQHPDLAHLPIAPVDAGWDNAMFRLGNRLSVRLPRRQIAAALIEHEQTWLPQIAGQLPIAVPAPCRVGTPALTYPWQWSILPWIEGSSADVSPPHPAEAKRLGEFFGALHTPAPPDAPVNPFRGVPLKQRAEAIAERFQRLKTKTDLITPAIEAQWEVALAAPIDTPPTWIHGDLHPRNVLVKHGLLSGMIDWGDMTAGDRATDLAAVWMLFDDRGARLEALTACGPVSEATRQRALGWAIFFGVVLLDTGLADHPRHAAIGEKTLRRIAEAEDASI